MRLSPGAVPRSAARPGIGNRAGDGGHSSLNRWLDAVDRRLTRVPRGLLGAVTLVAIIGIGALDLVTGNELSSAVFYTVPIGAAAWYAGRRWGWAACGLAAATWFLADTAAGASYSHDWIPFWNAGVRLGVFLLIAGLLARLREAIDALRCLAEVDALTGVATARHFAATVEAEVRRARRYRHPVSLGFVDLDGFKAINDGHGHAAGDAVLAAVGQVLEAHLRGVDLAGRLGGDEFAVLLPETDAAGAREVFDKLRAALETVVATRGWPVGFSIGVITSAGQVRCGTELIRLADELMYRVKHAGKGSTAYGAPPR